ncbi:GNAT family N-acetyltransferase [Campylobacter sp. RM12640]|uniref:GNAT family N-acetyltransferase n=1 Tax=unclassified Campylobacter TaxID=2593542 RepID=UPI003014A202|nr:GNAT family N-acetyltransferase [Campylobacter sp. RM12640]MBZ7989225.1 GNAT family N-acetyltransferase [Campylobacter sp. RM12635]
MELIEISSDEFFNFAKDVQNTFQISLRDKTDENVITIDEIFKSLENKNAKNFYVYDNGVKIGGICLLIDENTQHNNLDLFYILEEFHNKGYGFKTWQMVEKTFPKTKVWTTTTPYFEIRNIHFYVNKCGFKIVKLSNLSDKFNNIEEVEWFFDFEKIMNN